MTRAAAVWLLALAATAPALEAQAVPETSQAARLKVGLRRWPQLGVDPFRHTFSPGWGLVVQAGAMGANNSFNAPDVGALILLSDSNSLLIGDVVDALGLVPVGQGVNGLASGEGGAYLGGPLGGSFSLGLTAQGRGYGAFQLDGDAVRLFREGNAQSQEFLLGETDASALATAEGGVHALISAGPVGSVDGPRATLGFGGRYLKPVFYARAEMDTDSRVFVSDTSLAASVQVDAWTPGDGTVAAGSGIAADFLVRLAWPTSGFAIEAMIANLGRVTIDSLTHEVFSFNVRTASLQEVTDSLDAARFDTVGVESREVTLPRIVRFAASGWANRILQLDVAATLPVENEFKQALLVELGSTWRLGNSLPLRAGLVLGGRQGIGYTGGFAFEARNLLLRLTGSSLGGLFRNAKGVAGRFEFGFFF